MRDCGSENGHCSRCSLIHSLVRRNMVRIPGHSIGNGQSSRSARTLTGRSVSALLGLNQ